MDHGVTQASRDARGLVLSHEIGRALRAVGENQERIHGVARRGLWLSSAGCGA